MEHLNLLIERYPKLAPVKDNIKTAFEIISDSYRKGGKLLIAGNGGSAADAEHITGELMKSFVKKRKIDDEFIFNINKIDSETAQYLVKYLQPGLPVIALPNNISLNTAAGNDIDGDISYAQQVYVYGQEGDVFLGISTSGNAKNVFYAAAAAKAKKLKVIALTGAKGGKLKYIADVSINVPETETYKIQELHLPVYHCLCLMLEDYFF